MLLASLTSVVSLNATSGSRISSSLPPKPRSSLKLLMAATPSPPAAETYGALKVTNMDSNSSKTLVALFILIINFP